MRAHGGFTLLEVLLASIILGVGLVGILVSMSQAQRLMKTVPDLETSQEVMDLGDMAYPLDAVADEDDIDTGELRVSELWDTITDERMTDQQEQKFHGFTWERELIDKHMNDEDKEHFNNLRRVKITVTWGERGQGRGKKQQESYIVLWKEPEQ